MKYLSSYYLYKWTFKSHCVKYLFCLWRSFWHFYLYIFFILAEMVFHTFNCLCYDIMWLCVVLCAQSCVFNPTGRIKSSSSFVLLCRIKNIKWSCSSETHSHHHVKLKIISALLTRISQKHECFRPAAADDLIFSAGAGEIKNHISGVITDERRNHYFMEVWKQTAGWSWSTWVLNQQHKQVLYFTLKKMLQVILKDSIISVNKNCKYMLRGFCII